MALHLPCFLYDKVNSLINVLEGGCSWLWFLEISINVNNDVYNNNAIGANNAIVKNIVVYIYYSSIVVIFLFTMFYAGICCYIKQCYNL